MNYEELVNSIVAEVYKKIKGNTLATNEIIKKKAVVLWDMDMDKYSNVNSKYDFIAYEEGIREYDVVVISSLCLRGLANLALGSSISSEERFILKAIMMGKKVYVIESGIEYKKYINTAPVELYKKYISFERELRMYGVQIIASVEEILFEKQTSAIAANVIETTTINEENKVKNTEVLENVVELRNKKLISEADLRRPEIRGAQKIVINKKTKITPLAADYIRTNNLKVERV